MSFNLVNLATIIIILGLEKFSCIVSIIFAFREIELSLWRVAYTTFSCSKATWGVTTEFVPWYDVRKVVARNVI